jgi:hypothetical protein
MVSRSQTKIDRSGRSSLRKSKSLAVQTAKATADVGRQICVIQEGMHQSVNEITAVGCPSLQTREVVVACAHDNKRKQALERQFWNHARIEVGMEAARACRSVIYYPFCDLICRVTCCRLPEIFGRIP